MYHQSLHARECNRRLIIDIKRIERNTRTKHPRQFKQILRRLPAWVHVLHIASYAELVAVGNVAAQQHGDELNRLLREHERLHGVLALRWAEEVWSGDDREVPRIGGGV